LSIRLYKKVFGFGDGNKLEIHYEFQPLMSFEGDVHLRSAFLRSGGPVIERLEFTEPWPIKSESHMLHNTGLNHLSFNVDALDPIIADVLVAGGMYSPRLARTFFLATTKGR
jgi:hypothetical protein